MYATLLFIHSIFRWLVLATLLLAIGKAYLGKKKQKAYTPLDNFIRHSTATIAHIQLLVGILLYTQSPIVKHLSAGNNDFATNPEPLFFGIIHTALMLLAIVSITAGSAMAKRKTNILQKHNTVLLWYSIGLLIILLAIPWPFSPLAHRPYIRIY